MKTFNRVLIFITVTIIILSVNISAQINNMDIIKGMYNSFTNGNIPAVLDAMDQNIEWNEAENFPYADGNPYIGPTAVLEGVFYRLGSEWEYWTLDDITLHETTDNMVIATGFYNAKNKKTGKVIKSQFTHHWSINNSKVTRFQQYADTKQVSDAMPKSYDNRVDEMDAEKIDPQHYKVEFENDQVKVLRITYGPGEKSKMHSHTEGVVVFLTDGKGKFALPEGKTMETNFESGKVIWTDSQTHQPENTGDESFELIQIELKKQK